MIGLSALSHGTVAEKLLWTFNLYDLNRDGEINRAEMCEVITSIYALLGRHTKPPVNKSSQQNHIDTVFNVSAISYYIDLDFYVFFRMSTRYTIPLAKSLRGKISPKS